MTREQKIINDIDSRQIANGLKIITAPSFSHPVVSLQLYVRTGSCRERSSEGGYSHFLEHLVFKSTRKFPDNQLTDRAMFLGSNLNAYTEFDSTCFYLTLSSMFLEEGLELLSELAFNANFSEKDFQNEKKVVIEEIAYYKNDPEDFFLEELPSFYFSESPYRKPILGSIESLKAAKIEDLQRFYRQNYSPQNCFLVVSGMFEPDSLLDKAEKYFGGWNGRSGRDSALITKKPTHYPEKPVVKIVNKKVTKPMLAFALPELSNTDPRSHSLDIISRIFANGKKSRLYRRLFIEEKIVDQVRMESFSGISDGMSVIVISPKSEKAISVVFDIFLEEFRRLDNIVQTEIDEAKTDMIYAHRYSLEYAKSVGFNLGLEEVLGDYRNFYSYVETIEKVSKKEIAEMVHSTYRADNLGLFVLSPETMNNTIETALNSSLEKLKTGFEPAVKDRPSEKNEEYQELILDSGAGLSLKKIRSKPTVGITAVFPVSQLNERQENRGINYLTSILLLYGNDKMSYNQLLDYCSRLGIQVSVSTSDELTFIKIKCFNESLSLALQLLADIIATPLFPAEHFLNIQQTIISNLERSKDFPSQYASYLWKKQLLGTTSNILEREGAKSTVRKLTRKKVVNWYYKNYRLSEMRLSIAGDISFDEVTRLTQRLFPEISSAIEYEADSREAIIAPEAKFRKSSSRANNGAIVHVGGMGCPARDVEKSIAFNILSRIMGGDITSRLYLELREKRGLAYNAGLGFNQLQDLGFFAAYAIVDKKNGLKTIDLIKKCFQQVVEDGITKHELETAKNAIRGQRLRAEESVLTQASTIASLRSLGYRYDFYLDREKRLSAVEAADVVAAAAGYFRPDNLFIHLYE